ncbi:MAG: hypothetical protein JWN50_50 [Parcubacteria group bacterium]|nr:hypothetical protein [Parcubacteria group bacterium]
MPYTIVQFRRDRDESWNQLKRHVRLGALAPLRTGIGQSKAVSRNSFNTALFKKELIRWLKMFGQIVWFFLKLLFFRLRLAFDK